MADCWNNLKSLVHVVAFVFFTVQLVFAVEKYMAKPTMSSPETKPFSSLNNPLQITVCKEDQFDYFRAHDLGYSNANSYLTGKTMNLTVLSWTGLGGNLTFEETRNFLYNSTKDVNFNYGQHITGPVNGTISNKFIISNGICKVFVGKFPRFIKIQLHAAETGPHLLYITDPKGATSFQLPYSRVTGDQIQLTPPAYATHDIQIKETSVYTDDGSCVDYPNNRYESYSDCVNAEMRARILPTLGCMVPWISEEDACVGHIQILTKNDPIVKWIFNIAHYSLGGVEYESESCPHSCTHLSAHSKKTFSGFKNHGNSFINLYFRKEIKIEKVMLAYDSTALLVEVGSCLGLWLGLSVVGIFDLVVLAALTAKKLLRKQCQPGNEEDHEQ